MLRREAISLLMRPFTIVLYFADVDISARYGVYGKCGYALQSEFFHYVVAVGDYGGQADVKARSYLLVDEAFHDECHHLYFARRKLRFCWQLWVSGHVAPAGVCSLFE